MYKYIHKIGFDSWPCLKSPSHDWLFQSDYRCITGQDMGVSTNGGIQNGWFIMEHPSINGWFGGTPISGNHHSATRIGNTQRFHTSHRLLRHNSGHIQPKTANTRLAPLKHGDKITYFAIVHMETNECPLFLASSSQHSWSSSVSFSRSSSATVTELAQHPTNSEGSVPVHLLHPEATAWRWWILPREKNQAAVLDWLKAHHPGCTKFT